MQNALTDLSVRTLPPGTYWDSRTRGLGLRVGKQSRTFIVLVRSGLRRTLGRYPYLTLQAARKEVARIKAEAVLGRIEPARVPFADAVADFLKDCKTRVRPRTLKNYTDYLRMLDFDRRPVAGITPRELVVILNNQVPSQREQLHRVARNFFRWCVRQHILDRSPLNALPLPSGRPRARVLTEDELRAVWMAARAGTTPFHAIVVLVILTGARRGEMSPIGVVMDWGRHDHLPDPGH